MPALQGGAWTAVSSSNLFAKKHDEESQLPEVRRHHREYSGSTVTVDNI